MLARRSSDHDRMNAAISLRFQKAGIGGSVDRRSVGVHRCENGAHNAV